MDDVAITRALDAPVPRWDERAGLRPAAVLAPLIQIDGRDHLLFTKRPDAMRDHAGQVAFPGGRREGGETPLACALRESEEEIGLSSGDVAAVLGALPARVSNAGYVVHTIVARVRVGFEPVPDAREVDRVMHAALQDLVDPARWVWRDVPGVRRRLPFFDLDRDREVADATMLWGLTGRLTWDLLERLGFHLPQE